MRQVCSLVTILLAIQMLIPSAATTTGPAAGPPGKGPDAEESIVKFLTASFSKPPDPELAVESIAPLYTEPKLPDEGIWVKQDLSGGQDAVPLVYRTTYRPSADFPNAIVHMLLFNMKHLSPKVYLGSCEPYKNETTSCIDDAKKSRLLAVTNALWQSKHAGRVGIIADGEVLKKMEPGVATIIVYKNGSIDIVEWNDQIPVSEIRDARQLMHLIVKDGQVVTSLMKRGQPVSAEIGLGSLLCEDRPIITLPAATPEEKPTQKMNFTSGDLWFLATRSAFGIRPDGNLVFAVGHHIGTTDLAKALVLAGCVRGIHGDANPGNCVGVLYFTDANGAIVRKAGLTPLQDRAIGDRYLSRSYPKDFFAFFKRATNGN